jgi:ketosteroid isomerase-like protein
MAEHPNAVKIRTALDAVNDRDFATYMDIYGEDVVAHMAPPYGTIRGRSAFFDVMKQWDQFAGGTMHVDVEAIIADDEYAMVFCRGLADHGQKHQDLRFVWAGEVDGEGRFKEFWYLADDEPSHEDFWTE